MTRTVLRYVNHTIRHVPEGGWIFEVVCKEEGCGEESGPQGEQEDAQDWALTHAGLARHYLFERRVTDHAQITREE